MKEIKHAWEMNESLLQSYRSTFIISQAVFLIVGGLFLDREVSVSLMVAIGIFAIFIIWYIWFRVVRARALVVDYYKIQLLFDFTNHPDFCESIDEYENNLRKRKSMNKAAGVRSNWRMTRIKLDLGMPLIYTLIWLFLVIEKFL